MSEERTHTPRSNRLVNEKSPYLLQHAHNPVDWFPWGEEAFSKAREENKPIFLSVGYSTCYWCHVMEREVFENESIAALMNRLVVSIKVDREERPDIDRIYMAALQAMTGSGGWPMSMFLTPDLKPFFGATYIPPTERYGRPGFPEILRSIHEAWLSKRANVVEAGERISNYIHNLSDEHGENGEASAQALNEGFQFFRQSYDKLNGGFGGAPKFPRPVVFSFLLRYYARTGNREALDMVLETLRRMANGGMYDHIGGGFHRYSTDERWHVPHFEKMLYDQAQLVVSYLEAFQISRDSFFSNVAKDIFNYVLRDLRHPDGGFFSAEDAESAPDASRPDEKTEGAFYLWTKEEIESILTQEEAALCFRVFEVESKGNVVADSQGIFGGKNILHVVVTLPEAARQFSLPEERIAAIFARCRMKLFAAREKRPRPHLDDKILTSWNGLMISAFARGFQVLGDPRYLEAARQSASFILRRARGDSGNQLFHRYRDGESRIDAMLEDYAFLAQALIDLYESTFEINWLETALKLTEAQMTSFYDEARGGFFDTTGKDPSVLVRTKEWYDGAEPSGNSIAILNLLRLAQMTNNETMGSRARQSLACFAEHMMNASQATPQLLAALDFSLSKPAQIVIAAPEAEAGGSLLLQQVHSRFIPNKVLLLADGSAGQEFLAPFVPFVISLKMIDSKPTAYVCENFACQIPTTDPVMLAKHLDNIALPVGSFLPGSASGERHG